MSFVGIVEHFRTHPEAMAAFHDLADRFGQELQCTMAGPNDVGLPEDCVIVRYKISRIPLAVIRPDGSIWEVPNA